MALTFSATFRVFAEQSKPQIARKLEDVIGSLHNTSTPGDYEAAHQAFCEWFMHTIRPNKRRAIGTRCSYGQAAKVLDVCAKVYVCYCNRPSAAIASKIGPMLHCAIDTEILNHLRRKYTGTIQAKHMSDIDSAEYAKLQALVARDIRENFAADVHPVDYDDIMWRRLARAASEA